jgi:hypothetical protein
VKQFSQDLILLYIHTYTHTYTKDVVKIQMGELKDNIDEVLEAFKFSRRRQKSLSPRGTM